MLNHIKACGVLVVGGDSAGCFVAIKAAANFQKLFIEGVKMAPEIVEECLKQGEVINQRVQEFEKANSVPLQDNGAEA